jgi:hypothetical protein
VNQLEQAQVRAARPSMPTAITVRCKIIETIFFRFWHKSNQPARGARRRRQLLHGTYGLVLFG